jgi:hypothetical protein
MTTEIETILFPNEITACIAGDECLSVTIHASGIIPFEKGKVTEYLQRGFSCRHAVSACIGWREEDYPMNEDSQMMGN